MRYVFIAFVGLAVAFAWANNSTKGRQIKRHLLEHPAEPARLY